VIRRLGLFGGTFDPPHVGHLALAEWARESLRLDLVLFVPAGRPPHKSRADLSDTAARLAMTRLAVRGQPAFRVSNLETRRDGPSFTVDTLREVRDRFPSARRFLLIGADSLADLSHWRNPEEIVRLATLVVAVRPGEKAARGRLAFGRRPIWLDNPGLEVSSSTIRARARAGRSVRYLVPDAVVRYIESHRLYRRSRRIP